MRHQPSFIHETAVVEAGAELGRGVRVWHHAHVRAGARLGDGSSLGKNAYVAGKAVIGARCRVQNNVSIYDGIVLEDDVFVGPSAVFINDPFPRANSDTWKPIRTLVRSGASIGGNATVLCGVIIGEWAVVGAAAVVTRDVDPHAVVIGNPARWHAWACRCGRVLTRLRKPGAAVKCEACGEITLELGNDPD